MFMDFYFLGKLNFGDKFLRKDFVLMWYLKLFSLMFNVKLIIFIG